MADRLPEERQREQLRLARGLIARAERSVALAAAGPRAPVAEVALRAARGLDALGERVVLVHVAGPAVSGARRYASIPSTEGAVELVLEAPAGRQLADEIQRWRGNLDQQFGRIVWNLEAVDLAGVDAAVAWVVGSVVVVARAGAVDERTVAGPARALPSGVFRGVVLVG